LKRRIKNNNTRKSPLPVRFLKDLPEVEEQLPNLFPPRKHRSQLVARLKPPIRESQGKLLPLRGQKKKFKEKRT